MKQLTRTTSSRTVAANVRAEKARRNVSTTQLAEGIGLGRVALSRRLNGHAQWTIDEIAAIARFLDVSIDSLIQDHSDASSRLASKAVPA